MLALPGSSAQIAFTNGATSSFSANTVLSKRVCQSSQLRPSGFSWSEKLVQGFAAALMVKLERQGAVGQTTCFSRVSLLDRSFFLCNLSSLFFSPRPYGHRCYLPTSRFIPRARQSSPHFRDLGKDATLRLNLKREVCGRNCRKKAFSPPLLLLPSSPWALLLTHIFPSAFSALFSRSQGSNSLFGICMPLR